VKALQKSTGQMAASGALQGSSRRSETATVLISGPLGRITSTALKPWLNDRCFDQPEQAVGHFFFGAFEEGDGFGFGRKHFNGVCE
jgi:hypothetical protein